MQPFTYLAPALLLSSVTLANATPVELTDKLTAGDAATGDYFGWSVGIFGGTATVGARSDDSNGTDSGARPISTRRLLCPFPPACGCWAQRWAGLRACAVWPSGAAHEATLCADIRRLPDLRRPARGRAERSPALRHPRPDGGVFLAGDAGGVGRP